MQLILAARDGRLLGDEHEFAVWKPARSAGPGGSSWLHRLDRQWDVAVFGLPPLVVLILAFVLAAAAPDWQWTRLGALALVALALLWVSVAMTAGVLRMVAELVRRRPVTTAVSQLREHNPTVVLLHASTPAAATALVARVVAATGTTTLVLTDGVTRAAPDDTGVDGLCVEALAPTHPVLVARRLADPPPATPAGRGRFRARDTAVILGGSAVVLAIVAGFVAWQEGAACGADCQDAVDSYGEAIYWMANRLLGGDPENLGVSSPFARVVGVFVTVYGLYVLVAIVGAVVRQRIDDDLRSAADVVAEYEAARAGSDDGYPVASPQAHGWLDVGDGHRVYWETYGNPDGAPAVVLHDGPGWGADRSWTRLLDPAAYRIVLLDQRGSGRSTPDAAEPSVSLDANTTDHLVDDLERLREHLRIERWLVLGGAWGSTLALAYAQRHPRSVSAMVLFSVSGTTREEIDWATRGMRRFLPADWERFRDALGPDERDGDLVAAYAQLLAHPDPDERDRAAREWCAWGERQLTANTAARPDPRFADPAFRMRSARLATHYRSHAAWLGDDELIDGAHRLAGIPGILIHGRADLSKPPHFAHRLHEAWSGSTLVLVDDAGHGADALLGEIVKATDRLAPLVGKQTP